MNGSEDMTAAGARIVVNDTTASPGATNRTSSAGCAPDRGEGARRSDRWSNQWFRTFTSLNKRRITTGRTAAQRSDISPTEGGNRP